MLVAVLLHGGWLRASGAVDGGVATAAGTASSADAGGGSLAPELPDAPEPAESLLLPGQAAQSEQAAQAGQAAGSTAGQGQTTATPAKTPAPTTATPGKAASAKAEPHCEVKPCPLKTEAIDWYKRFMDGPQVKPLTPREKAHLAARNIIDPFNALTILAQSGFYVGFNAHSPYGPGMPGFERNVGVSYSQDITSEFFNVFLIPSIAHQNPHYHRMPGASLKRRFVHATMQIFWTLGDNGQGMLNYANLVGSGVDIAIGNLYVPGQQTHLTAALSEYFVGLATAPIDNYITEFLPDIARHIHVQIVLVQDIINQVSRTAPPAN